ncbi:hypothetical protein ACJ6IB_09230 [Acinetobacter baumannii]|uniref:Uncharacterized protein n=1 Tax=Acinetobacter nosocomialis 28F TaxID=1147131 RepID=A0AA36KAW8_ACINO|nr:MULTISPECIES: hypothetical protein [Acinetobacter]MCG5960724.1 hypothetical protein [Acinetobacter baumannii]PNH14258.1 hypothetical protein DSM30011_012750 [Acinetobacter baumannii]UMO41680.1 hypothetical protein L2Z44_10615 [Acinetobacter baumannii]CDG74723.1 hypothetical protein ANICBIBUN_04577 [Acinetobacter nosocomialis 28F]SSO23540.1 Uncharacterised protein [Acinetobacter baumannii]
MANIERRNFGASINLGIQASDVKKDNIKSIFEVINAVKEDLEAFTENKVSLGMRDSQKHQLLKFTALLATFNSNHPAIINPTNQVIFVFSILDNSKTEDLTVLEFDSNGLPCTIYIDGNRITSADIQSFQDSIETLLSSPNTGEKIKRLMNVKNQENVTEAQSITFAAESNENKVVDDDRI